MKTIKVSGDIVPNNDEWFYRWFDEECTCPKYVEDVLKEAEKDEEIEVLINSGGGSVGAGQEIYSMLREKNNVTIKVQSMAASAASVIAMAGRCIMSPVAMMMVHNVKMGGVAGDYHDMQKNAEILKQLNAALAESYIHKTGKSKEDILKMMDRETWLTANQCVELGFADEILEDQSQSYFTNVTGNMWLTDELRARAIKEKTEKEEAEKLENEKKALTDDLFLFGI